MDKKTEIDVIEIDSEDSDEIEVISETPATKTSDNDKDIVFIHDIKKPPKDGESTDDLSLGLPSNLGLAHDTNGLHDLWAMLDIDNQTAGDNIDGSTSSRSDTSKPDSKTPSPVTKKETTPATVTTNTNQGRKEAGTPVELLTLPNISGNGNGPFKDALIDNTVTKSDSALSDVTLKSETDGQSDDYSTDGSTLARSLTPNNSNDDFSVSDYDSHDGSVTPTNSNNGFSDSDSGTCQDRWQVISPKCAFSDSDSIASKSSSHLMGISPDQNSDSKFSSEVSSLSNSFSDHSSEESEKKFRWSRTKLSPQRRVQCGFSGDFDALPQYSRQSPQPSTSYQLNQVDNNNIKNRDAVTFEITDEPDNSSPTSNHPKKHSKSSKTKSKTKKSKKRDKVIRYDSSDSDSDFETSPSRRKKFKIHRSLSEVRDQSFSLSKKKKAELMNRSLSVCERKSEDEEKAEPIKLDLHKCCKCNRWSTGSVLSECTWGQHLACQTCVEPLAKAAIKDGGWVSCVVVACNSVYTTDQLRRTLPSMVVDILEEKNGGKELDYLSYLVQSAEEKEVPDVSQNASENNPPEEQYIPNLPGHWAPMLKTTKDYVLVDVEGGCPEYEQLAVDFHATMPFPDMEIISVKRIQNHMVWQFFSVKKTQMEQTNGKESIMERMLFHGTTDDLIGPICKTNFDWRVCGSNGTNYGKGSYFARDAKYSHVYTLAGRRGHLPTSKHRMISMQGANFPKILWAQARNIQIPAMNINPPPGLKVGSVTHSTIGGPQPNQSQVISSTSTRAPASQVGTPTSNIPAHGTNPRSSGSQQGYFPPNPTYSLSAHVFNPNSGTQGASGTNPQQSSNAPMGIAFCMCNGWKKAKGVKVVPGCTSSRCQSLGRSINATRNRHHLSRMHHMEQLSKARTSAIAAVHAAVGATAASLQSTPSSLASGITAASGSGVTPSSSTISPSINTTPAHASTNAAHLPPRPFLNPPPAGNPSAPQSAHGATPQQPVPPPAHSSKSNPPHAHQIRDPPWPMRYYPKSKGTVQKTAPTTPNPLSRHAKDPFLTRPRPTPSQPAPAQNEDIRKMFCARVLTGNCALGAPCMVKPPPLDVNDPYGRAFDSCVDRLDNPKIFVIFDNAQCYPEYIIEYKVSAQTCDYSV
ncbi:unnamed protein product [Owenia fusiformis]|uniref:Poly [ADP-ribose] polymerase n=1 Tax=Owenia fusiformis TaxID=6347 RepID=A0A8S4QBK1_OWEFU|nr:unnamed protein product [Owenia fusiformis]